MITLKNERLTLEVALLGAEMRKLTLDGKDILWCGDPALWEGVAPVLFPICGSVKNDAYTLDGNTYEMPQHGFAQYERFEVTEKGQDFVTLRLKSTPATREKYPFDFRFFVTYRLVDTKVDITYKAENCSKEEMLFSMGSHEGYACPEGLSAYDLVFEQSETLHNWLLDGPLLSGKTMEMLQNETALSLKDEYFEMDTLVFKGIQSRQVTLKNRLTGKAVTVKFPQAENLLIWSIPGAPYVCIEPWLGIPGFADGSSDLREKPGMSTVKAGESFTYTHSICL